MPRNGKWNYIVRTHTVHSHSPAHSWGWWKRRISARLTLPLRTTLPFPFGSSAFIRKCVCVCDIHDLVIVFCPIADCNCSLSVLLSMVLAQKWLSIQPRYRRETHLTLTGLALLEHRSYSLTDLTAKRRQCDFLRMFFLAYVSIDPKRRNFITDRCTAIFHVIQSSRGLDLLIAFIFPHIYSRVKNVPKINGL